jgi:hypothetical protein
VSGDSGSSSINIFGLPELPIPPVANGTSTVPSPSPIPSPGGPELEWEWVNASGKIPESGLAGVSDPSPAPGVGVGLAHPEKNDLTDLTEAPRRRLVPPAPASAGLEEEGVYGVGGLLAVEEYGDEVG